MIANLPITVYKNLVQFITNLLPGTLKNMIFGYNIELICKQS